MKQILVCGSIANDFIMGYPNKISDLVVPECLDTLNLAFTVPTLEKVEGGTAQNIAYSLGLLGLKEQTIMVGSVGKDFIPSSRLANHINYNYIFCDNNLFTAVCYVITALGGQQIVVFHPGAMAKSADIQLKSHLSSCFSEISYAIIAPNDKQAMLRELKECKDASIPTFFDPGQALELFSLEELRQAMSQATYLICNEHEFSLLQRRSDYSEKEIISLFDKIVVTLGKKGFKLLDAEKEIVVPGIVVENPVDATGCGDAFRSGLLYGLVNERSWEESAKIGNIVASFAVQSQGGMAHSFSLEDILSKLG